MLTRRLRSESGLSIPDSGELTRDRMIYSSITPYVHMLYTAEDEQEHIELDFSGERRRRGEDSMFGYDSFGVSRVIPSAIVLG